MAGWSVKNSLAAAQPLPLLPSLPCTLLGLSSPGRATAQSLPRKDPSVKSPQIPPKSQEAIGFVKDVIASLEASKQPDIGEPILYLRMQLAQYYLLCSDLPQCKALVEEGREQLDALADVSRRAGWLVAGPGAGGAVLSFCPSVAGRGRTRMHLWVGWVVVVGEVGR